MKKEAIHTKVLEAKKMRDDMLKESHQKKLEEERTKREEEIKRSKILQE